MNAGASQASSKPMSLLQKVAQDAKRRTAGGSQGGLALARELSQTLSIPPAGVLPPPKFQSSTAQSVQPAPSTSGNNACTESTLSLQKLCQQACRSRCIWCKCKLLIGMQ